MNIYQKINKSLSSVFDVEYDSSLDFIESNYVNFSSKKFIPWNKGQTGIYSEETINLISKASMGNKKRLGKKFTKESKQKLSLKALNRDHSHLHKKVITPQGIFNSLTEASNHYKKSRSWVTKQLKNNNFKLVVLNFS